MNYATMYQCIWLVSSFFSMYIDNSKSMWYLDSMKADRKNYNTTLRIDLIRSLKILAAERDLRVNDILEEAIQDVLKKYEKEGEE